MISNRALEKIANVKHGFFTRNRGTETFGQRNCAYRACDTLEEVDHNRAACAQAVGTPLSHLVTVKQRHTADVIIADQPLPWTDAPIADAIVTCKPGLSVGVLTADCVPVLLADTTGQVVAAAHAGWKGALVGVLENTLRRMEEIGAARKHIVAVVGPCIGRASYEVGPEFKARFVAHDKSYASFFDRERADGHCYFDLAGFAVSRLKNAGIGEVVVSGVDTCAEEALFFSYRRAVVRKEPDYGRQLSVIAIQAR